MKNFDSLVDIWQAQKSAPEINYKHIISHFKKSRNTFITKLIIGLVSMALFIFTIVFLWVKTPISYATTHISFIVFILCGLYYIRLQVKNLRILSTPFCAETPKKYIQQLLKFKKLKHKQSTHNYLFYSIAIAFGFVLFFIEFFATVNIYVILFSIIFTAAWFTLCYYYLKKIYIKRENKEIAQMLNDLERIKNQFE